MAQSSDITSESRWGMDREEVIRFQTELVRSLGARIGIDGDIGPLTIAAARDAVARGASFVDPAIMALASTVSAMKETGQPYTWAFQTDGEVASNPDSGEIDRDLDLFWKRGVRASAESNVALGTCDTVLLLSHSQVVAIGVLLAGDSLTFVDADGYLRHPVRIWRHLDRPVLIRRPTHEAAVGIAQVAESDLGEIRSALGEPDIQIPVPLDKAYSLASERRLEDYLRTVTGILPNRETASALDWKGSVWEPIPHLVPDSVIVLDDTPTDFGTLVGSTQPIGANGAAVQDAPIDSDPPADKDAETVAGTQSEDASSGSDAHFPFVLDAPVGSEDDLDRGPFALFLAQRLHLIWCQLNGCAPGPDGKRTGVGLADADTFIAQVDSPWGGGKTTFANFVARVLDPRWEVLSQRHFLRSSIAPTDTDADIAKHQLGKVFVPDFAKNDEKTWPEAHRPWIISRYNAWRDQYVAPPWWHVFQTIETAIAGEVWREGGRHLRPGKRGWNRPGASASAFSRWISIKLLTLGYKLGNSRVKSQLLLFVLMFAFLVVLWALGIVHYAVDAATSRAAGINTAKLDPKELGAWVSLAVGVLGVTGASVATLFTVVTQSLSPDLDFSAEHKQIGVRDPISRFRKTFHRILKLSRRPVLLIVDDLDRCEPKTVVEILRGFQTIVRSPRLFVLLLGDRAWIETAHDIYHKDLATMRGSEGTLGSLFVQKVIQLSFRLPIIKEDARARYARRVLGDVEARSRTADTVLAAITEADRGFDQAVKTSGSLADRERKVEAAKKEATEKLMSLGVEERKAAETVIDQLANVRMVAAAGADTRQQQSVAQAVERLIHSLPNNPRQIKRIFMAFSTYEAVGRAYFGYSLTAQGDDGARKARRWRQLAMWVTLSTEWPDSWRAIAQNPLLADAAFGDESERAAAENSVLIGLTEEVATATAATLRRLRGDAELVALLGRDPAANDDFGWTRLESEAVYEFNRIIWEPGFQLRTARRGDEARKPVRPPAGRKRKAPAR